MIKAVKTKKGISHARCRERISQLSSFLDMGYILVVMEIWLLVLYTKGEGRPRRIDV